MQEGQGVTWGRAVSSMLVGLLSRGGPGCRLQPSSCSPARPVQRAATAPFSFPTLLKFPELLTRSRELVPIQQFV